MVIKVPGDISYSANLHMTNLRTDEMVFFRNLMKIDTDENKAFYSSIKISTSFFFTA